MSEVSKRGRTIVWGVGLALIGTIGVLWALKDPNDPEAIKAELAGRMEELNRIPNEEAIRKDKFVEELRDNELYKTYAKALWLKIERVHRGLHDAAELERAAQKEVLPFFADCKDISRIERAALQDRIGEVRALLDKYGATRYGDALRTQQAALTAKLESMPKPVTPMEVMDLNRNVKLALSGGRAFEALDLIETFLKRPGAAEYRNKIDPSLATVRAKADVQRRGVTPR